MMIIIRLFAIFIYSILGVWLVNEIFVYFYMHYFGVAERIDLSEDYGFGFIVIILDATTLIVLLFFFIWLSFFRKKG
ncbi:hypothetical protein Acidovoranil_26970 [Acidovorax sp. FG27]